MARRAWCEFFMFPKCCLRVHKRGLRPIQAAQFTRTLLLRWKSGERLSLWTEIPEIMGGKKKKTPKEEDKTRYDQVSKMVSQGRLSHAMQRLTSPGLAATNDVVKQKLLLKFPPFDWGAKASTRLAPPPAGELTPEGVAQAIRSFKVGAGPGPSGLRSDFLKQCLGSANDDEILPVFCDFAQLLADGKAPGGVRAWLCGGTLVGVGKANVPLDKDARPIVMGEVWRKVVWKSLLKLDITQVKERLLPNQLAVGVSGGVEAMIHGTRQWLDQARHHPTKVLLKRDIRNAFNTAAPDQFLKEAVAHMPAASLWADWCYSAPSHLIYDGGVLEHASQRGQQGCPGMAALFCLLRRKMVEEALGSDRGPEFQAEYADDSFAGGTCEEVLKMFKAEVALAEKYGLHFDLQKCVLYLPSGEGFRGDLGPFRDMGVSIKRSANVEMLQTMVTESPQVAQSFCEKKVGELQTTFEALMKIPQHHVMFHMLRHCESKQTGTAT